MDMKMLADYLAGAPQTGVAVMEVKEIPPTNPINEVIVNLFAVAMLAKDLHYRAHGKAFYAVHLLADLVWGVRTHIDSLIEVYYLGEQKAVPPLLCVFERKACDYVQKVLVGTNSTADMRGFGESQIMQALSNRLNLLAAMVEESKALACASGTNAVLDEISKTALQYIGLLGRTEANDTQGIPDATVDMQPR